MANKAPMEFHGFRCSPPLWAAALAKAKERNENISDVLRDALTDYVKKG